LRQNDLFLRQIQPGLSMKKYVAFISLIVLVSLFETDEAQRWKRKRWDFQFGLGTTHFFGDLGGGAKEAAHFLSFRDIDIASTRPLIHLGAQYKLMEVLSVKTSFTWGVLHSDDAHSGSVGRRHRNLHFRSPLYELSGQLKYFFIKEKVGSRYAISRGGLRNLINAYAFAGIGGIHFNPKASYNGEWYELQPMGTEGQGLKYPDNPDLYESEAEYSEKAGEYVIGPKYSLFELAFPIGIGAKYTLTPDWSIGLELGARYTTTDYLDDASGSYFNYFDYYSAYYKRNPDPEYPDGFYIHNPPRTQEELQAVFSDRHISYESGEKVRPEDYYPTPNENRVYQIGRAHV